MPLFGSSCVSRYRIGTRLGNAGTTNLVSASDMHTIIARALPLTVGAFTCLLPLVACSIDVRDGDSRGHSDVDIRTPAGSLSVRTDVSAHETGLPIYPGAWPARDDDDRDRANVIIGTPWFGLKVVAAKFESEDSPQTVLDFYKQEMRSYGRVTECRGSLDFKSRKGARQPVCRENLSSSHLGLIAGPEDRQHIVEVKPHGRGSEFSLVYIETRGDN